MAKEKAAQSTNKPTDIAKANKAAGGFFAGLKRAATSKPALIGAIALAMTGGAIAAYKTGYLSKAQAAIFAQLGKLTGGGGPVPSAGVPVTNVGQAAQNFVQSVPPVSSSIPPPPPSSSSFSVPPPRPSRPPPPPPPTSPPLSQTIHVSGPSLLRKVGGGAVSLGGKALGAAGRGVVRGVVSATWHPKTYAAALAGTALYKAYKYKNRERDPENSYLKHYLKHAKKDLSSMNLGKMTRETAEAYGERIAKTAKAFKNMQGIANDIGTGVSATLGGVKAMTGVTRKGIEATARGVKSGIQSTRQYLGRNNTGLAKTTGFLGTAARVMKNPVKSFAGGLLFPKTKGIENAGQKAWGPTGPHAHDARARQNAQKLLQNPAFVAMLLQRSAAGTSST